MFKIILTLCFAVFLCAGLSAQVPQQYIWKITFIADSVGKSKITVQNRCSESHDFRISGRSVPFLEFAETELRVSGGKSENVTVSVNTAKLRRSSYQGQVSIFCLTCAKEPGCSQSRDILNVTLNVVSRDELTNYRPSKEIGIDSPIIITSASSKAASSPSAVTSEAELKELLESLSGSAAKGPTGASSCGLPQIRVAEREAVKDCKGNCAAKLKAVREAEERVRTESARAEKYCLGLIQLENTTAFVEARAARAERQVSLANSNGSDARVLSSLKQESDNARKDALVFREKLESARPVANEAKAVAYAAMQELEDAVNAFDNCVKANPKDCN